MKVRHCRCRKDDQTSHAMSFLLGTRQPQPRPAHDPCSTHHMLHHPSVCHVQHPPAEHRLPRTPDLPAVLPDHHPLTPTPIAIHSRTSTDERNPKPRPRPAVPVEQEEHLRSEPEPQQERRAEPSGVCVSVYRDDCVCAEWGQGCGGLGAEVRIQLHMYYNLEGDMKLMLWYDVG
jgi:hypothetical protein